MRRFWWVTFIVFDVLVLCLFTAGYLARWIDPRTVWWPQLFAIGLPFLSLLILAFSPVLGYKKRWLLLGLHLIGVFLIVIRFMSLKSEPSEPVQELSTLRIASYNLGHFEIFSQAEQAKKLGEILRLLYPDIIGLQEFMVRYRGQVLRIRNLPYVANKFDSLGFQSVASQVHDVSVTFQPVLSRAEKLDQKEKRRLTIQEEGFPEMSVIRMQFEWMGREAVFYNLHLRTFGSKKPWLEERMSPMSPKFWLFYLTQYRDAFRYRAWQAEQIRNLAQKETLPLIISGDFNSTPHNWAYYHLAQNLQDVYATVGKRWQTSYHVKFSLARIDHMLVSSHWKVHRANIPRLDYSDHRPLLAVLGWAE